MIGAADPVRVFQEFATLDLISGGRAEIVVGRGPFAEAFPLFGLEGQDHDALFVERLGLLIKLRETTHVHWSGSTRPPLTGQAVYPCPVQAELPVWVGVGGTPGSFARAGRLGLPLMIGIIGGTFQHFRPLVELYRQAWRQAGHPAGRERVAVHAFGFLAATDHEARDTFYPGWQHLFAQAGRERGWAPPTRAQFDALCGPEGSFLIGAPRTVAAKVLAADATLGGIDRLTLQMSTALLPHASMERSIRLLGLEAAPMVRDSPSSKARSQAL